MQLNPNLWFVHAVARDGRKIFHISFDYDKEYGSTAAGHVLVTADAQDLAPESPGTAITEKLDFLTCSYPSHP